MKWNFKIYEAGLIENLKLRSKINLMDLQNNLYLSKYFECLSNEFQINKNMR